MIQGGICGRMLLCTLVTGIADSRRIGSIQRSNGLTFFSFCSYCCMHLQLKMQS